MTASDFTACIAAELVEFWVPSDTAVADTNPRGPSNAHPRFILALVAVLAAVAALAACGGDGDGLAAGRGVERDDSSNDDRDDDENEGDERSEDNQDDDRLDFCGLFDEFVSTIESIGKEGESDARETHEALDDLADDVIASAPPEIEHDVEIMMDTYRDLLDVAADHDYDVDEAIDDPAWDEIADDEEGKDAADAVWGYTGRSCDGDEPSDEPAVDVPDEPGYEPGDESADRPAPASGEFCRLVDELGNLEMADYELVDIDALVEQVLGAAPADVRPQVEDFTAALAAEVAILEANGYDLGQAALDPGYFDALTATGNAWIEVIEYTSFAC